MIVLLLGLSVFAYFFYHFYWKRRNLPPGPLPLPLIGNLYALSYTTLGNALKQWKAQYGDLHTIWFGNVPIVMITDAPTIFETIVKDGEAYTGRVRNRWNDVIKDGDNGIVMIDGPRWRENRRFTLKVLRDFGLGRNLMQERVLEEVTDLISRMKDQLAEGKTELDVQNGLDLAIGSIINNITIGYRYDKNNIHEFERIKKVSEFVMAQIGDFRNRLMEYNPEAFKRLPYFGAYYERYVNELKPLQKFFYNQIEEHRKAINFDVDDEPRDFVEAYIRQQHKIRIKNPDSAELFDDKELFGSLLDLWMAGQETTSTTLAWVVIALIQNPKVQEKLQAELNFVVGSDRIVTLDDKSNLNYLNAVLAEVQRYHCLGELNLPRRNTKDTEINGYHFPSGTVFMYDNHRITRDERYFPDPDTFKPERFLDANGKFFQPPELIPFGVGKRSCLGESLARLEMFLFIANLFNQFKMDYPSERKDFGKSTMSGVFVPLPFLCTVVPRQ